MWIPNQIFELQHFLGGSVPDGVCMLQETFQLGSAASLVVGGEADVGMPCVLGVLFTWLDWVLGSRCIFVFWCVVVFCVEFFIYFSLISIIFV